MSANPPLLSPSDFAARIKAKYPDYADVPDDVLTRRILQRYPDYREQVQIPATLGDSPADVLSREVHNSGLSITSAKRSIAHNAAVGGVPTSNHLTGNAFDVGGDPAKLDALYNRLLDTYGGELAEILREKDHVHVAWRGPAVTTTKGIAKSAQPTYRLERTDTGTMRKVLNKPRQEIQFEKGVDYDKTFPPEKPATRFDAIGQIGDYALGVAHKMGLPTVAGIKQDIADIASGGFLGKLWDATKAIPEAQGNELIAAYNEWEKAGASDHVPLTAIRHALGGIIPIIGPALSRSGGELEQGNIKEASQDFLAAALPIIAPVLFKSARGLVAKGVPPEQAIMQAADEHLSPLVTERMKSTLGGELRQPIPVEGTLGAGAKPRVLAHHSRFQPREATGEFKEGVPIKYHEAKIQPLTQLPDVGSNYREPLSKFSPTVFHDVSMGKAEGLLPTSNTMTSTGEMYLSNTPNLAHGQGGSSGVLLEFDANKLQGQVNRKPGWEIAYQNGEAEFVARHNKQVTYQDALRSVTIKPEMLGNKGEALRLSGALNRLEARGWTREIQFDGTLIYRKPEVQLSSAEALLPLRTTGIANAVTTAERTFRGLSPIETAMTREWSGPVLSKGKAMVDTDPINYRASVSSLADNPRILTDAENAALTYDRMRLHNEHAAAQTQIEAAIDSGDQVMAQRLGKQLNAIEDAINENDIAAKITGTEAGRGFNARKMMIAEDYSLASLVQKAKVAAGKPEVPEAVRAQLTDLSKQIADLTTRLNKAESASPKVLASRTSAANVVIRLEDAANAARARIAARKAGGQAGFIGEGEVGPEGLPGGADALADYATIGAAHLARIGADFATWSAEMVREFGDTVRPYLQQVYAAAKDQVQATQSGRLATYKKGLTRRTEAVESNTPQPPRSPLLLDPVAEALKKQLADAQAKARDVIDRQAPNYLARRVGREVVGVLNLPRAIKASLDISAPGRQGLFFGISHPVVFKRAFTYQLEALTKSPEAYQQMVTEMAADPDFIQAQRVGKVEFTGVGDKLNMHEEAYMSGLADKIPGVRHSEQAYSAFLNKQRLEMWKLYKGELESRGITPRTASAEYTAIGDFINKGTGRGNLGRLQGLTPVLNSVFFAPRWVASRIQLINPVYYVTLPKAARIIALRDAMKFATVVGTTLYLAKKAGATVDTDPDSPDFAKIKVGNVHYDISGGFQQELKFLFRLGRAANRTRKGELVKGQGGDKTVGDIATGYLRNKLSPVASTATDVFITGEMKKWGKERPDQLDEKPLKPTVGREALELFMPMVANDFIEAYQVEGGKGLAKAVPSTVGIGVNTYPGPSPRKQLKQVEGTRRREIKRERQINQ